MKSRTKTRTGNGNGPLPYDKEDALYLLRLGGTIRVARNQRGMTRKDLAEKSGVSERFLAELENGSGNASVLLLRKIAAAVGTPLELLVNATVGGSEDLSDAVELLKSLSSSEVYEARLMLRERFVRPFGLQRRERIALIGLRGAGKTTLGSKAAQQLGVPFIELDKLVEQEAGIPLAMVFELHGPAGFRKLEHECLMKVLKTEAKFVLATGGSIVAEPETYDLLLTNCFTIWLQATPEEHMSRVAAQGDMRPMSQSREAMADLKRILREREPLYAKADLVVNTSKLAISDGVESIVVAAGAKVLA